MLSIEVYSTEVTDGPIQVEMVISSDYIATRDILRSGTWSSILPFVNYYVYSEVSEKMLLHFAVLSFRLCITRHPFKEVDIFSILALFLSTRKLKRDCLK